MTSPPEMPGFDDLIEDLRLLRRHGLVRLRRLHLTALERLAAAPQPSPGALPDAMEALLRRAVAGFGDGSLGEAASYTFGLAQGTRDWPAQDRRRRAAEIYGVSVERFRKHQERTVFEQVAEQILRAVRPPELALAWRWDLDAADPRAAQQGAAVPSVQFGQRIDLAYPVPGAADVPVTVHVVTVELLTDIDVVVSPTNVHLELAKTYSATIAGALRTAAAWRDATGRICDDVLARELSGWLAAHDGYGATVPAGTVVPTSAGALAAQRIRRLYHAAVAVPRPASNDYHVAPETVARAVRDVFALARRERDEAALPLTSLCFPLIGAGRGGLPVAASIEVLWWALTAELARDPGWRIHLVDRAADRALLLVAHLLGNGARAA
jgi:O-acetyl-ADP-ribose deacetylase (regulator of RNase III)